MIATVVVGATDSGVFNFVTRIGSYDNGRSNFSSQNQESGRNILDVEGDKSKLKFKRAYVVVLVPDILRTGVAPPPTGVSKGARKQKTIQSSPADRRQDAFGGQNSAGHAVSDAELVSVPSQDDLAALYPGKAQRLAKTGKVKLLCTVLESGSLADCTVSHEEPDDYDFGKAALEISHLLHARPKMVDGVAEVSQIEVPISFSLDENN